MGKIVSFRIDDESIYKAMERFGLTVDDTKELTAKINSTALNLFKDWLKAENQNIGVSNQEIEELRKELRVKQELLTNMVGRNRVLVDEKHDLRIQVDTYHQMTVETGLVMVTRRQQTTIHSLRATVQGLRKKLRELNNLFESLNAQQLSSQDVNSEVDDFNNWLGD